jgi:hypothetical protein
MLAPIDMNGQRVINVGAPVDDNDVVRFKDIGFGSVETFEELLDQTEQAAATATTGATNAATSEVNAAASAAQAAATLASKANVVSPTFTGGVSLNDLATTAKSITARVGGLRRWIMSLGTAEAEGGANSGSNFNLVRYDDTGTSLGSVLTINRATGAATLSGRPSWGATPWDSANTPATTTSAALGSLSGDGTTATTVQKHIVRTYLDDVSGFTVGSGGNAATNATALNAYLATATAPLYLKRGNLYKIGATINFPSNCGLVCEEGWATVLMPAANFTNTTLNSYGTTAVGLAFQGLSSGAYTPTTNQRLEGVVVQSETNDGRYVRPVVVRNATNFSMDVEVFGVPLGTGVAMSGVRGKSNVSAYIHDFYTNSSWGAGAQSTGLDLSNDHISPAAASNITFGNIDVRDISFGATTLGLRGDQTDGMTMGADNGGHKLQAYHFERVGEGLDLQSKYNNIGKGIIRECREAGLKLVHGAAFNTFDTFNMYKVGRWGLCLAGSPNAGAGHTEGNVFAGGTISDLNYQNLYTSAATIGAIVLINNTAGPNNWRPTNNLIGATFIDEGQYGIYGYNDESGLGGNVAEPITYKLGPANVNILRETTAGSKVRFGGETTYRTTNYVG